MKPNLSVVIPTDRFETIERLVASLRNQTARGSIELVVVASSREALSGRERELEDFHSAQLVEAEIASLPHARAAGIRAASSDVVAFAESHAFPEPGWAEALIAAHAGPWAAVGPAMRSAHAPGSPGWGQFLLDYGRWAPPLAAGPVDDLPGHNSSYKRALLLDYGPELERMLGAEWVMHADLRRRGHALYLEPAAASRHVSPTRLGPAVAAWFHYSRGFAAVRSRGWPRRRRLLYVVGSPLIIPMRLRPAIAAVRRTGQARLIAAALPLMLITLAASAVGELVGYAVGGGEGGERNSEYELHRERYADDYDEIGDRAT
jgi:glycosyltransferase involved in cell wall biosynthesis